MSLKAGYMVPGAHGSVVFQVQLDILFRDPFSWGFLFCFVCWFCLLVFVFFNLVLIPSLDYSYCPYVMSVSQTLLGIGKGFAK